MSIDRMVMVVVVLFGLAVVGCGDDDVVTAPADAAAVADSGAPMIDTGAPTVDSASSIDASAIDASAIDASTIDAGAIDAGASQTPCGDMVCDRATQLCVDCACGGPDTFTCVPIPTGCESDRTCACVAGTVCPDTPPTIACFDTADNTVFCDTGLD
jgi:hypothetical protein